ncbi:MAG TPA: hypothetical protein VMQ76_06040 [Terracidiphilus sp.]|jgi:hypothetical protein|nr:hypothetical protein [Terracidiphilus sp.]
MSSIAIFDATSNSNSVYNTTQATSADAAQQTTTKITTPAATGSNGDTVTLSAAAQARVLHQSGQSIASIASALGTDTKTVDSYLGITVTAAIDQALQAAASARA